MPEWILAFIDGEYLRLRATALDIVIDPERLYRMIAGTGDVSKASICLKGQPNTKDIAVTQEATDTGFDIIYLSSETKKDAFGRDVQSGQTFTQFVMEELVYNEGAIHAHRVMLLTDDDDLVPVISSLQRQGLEVIVVSDEPTPNRMASEATQYIKLTDWAPHIRRQDPPDGDDEGGGEPVPTPDGPSDRPPRTDGALADN